MLFFLEVFAGIAVLVFIFVGIGFPLVAALSGYIYIVYMDWADFWYFPEGQCTQKPATVPDRLCLWIDSLADEKADSRSQSGARYRLDRLMEVSF